MSHQNSHVDNLEDAFQTIIEALGTMGYPVDSDPNFAGTPHRAAKGFAQLVWPAEEIERRLDELLGASFPASYDQMVLSKHNIAWGLCPHHLLPVIYRVSLAYIPKDKVLGISKLTRLARLMGRRPVLQEQYTEDLADILHRRLGSGGSAVYVEGLHLCMAARGVQAHETRVVTSAVRGMFRNKTDTRMEFLDLVRTSHASLI